MSQLFDWNVECPELRDRVIRPSGFGVYVELGTPVTFDLVQRILVAGRTGAGALVYPPGVIDPATASAKTVCPVTGGAHELMVRCVLCQARWYGEEGP